MPRRGSIAVLVAHFLQLIESEQGFEWLGRGGVFAGRGDDLHSAGVAADELMDELAVAAVGEFHDRLVRGELEVGEAVEGSGERPALVAAHAGGFLAAAAADDEGGVPPV